MIAVLKRKTSGKTPLDAHRRDFVKKEFDYIANLFGMMVRLEPT